MRFSNGELDEVATARLVLRRVTLDDLVDWRRIHEGPQYDHVVGDIVAHWREYGFGYWAIERDGAVVGFGGVRLLRDWNGRGDVLNLFYRLEPEARGNGFARETASAAIDRATLPVVARIRPENEPSVRVALRAGLVRRPDLDEGSGFVVYAHGFD